MNRKYVNKSTFLYRRLNYAIIFPDLVRKLSHVKKTVLLLKRLAFRLVHTLIIA